MTAVDAALLAWSAVVAVVSFVATSRSLRRPAPTDAPRPPPPLTAPLLVVRPCAGSEPSLGPNLATLGALRDPFVRVRFAVATRDDAAVPAITAACGTLTAAGIDARMVVTEASAPNQKSDHLARVIAAEPDAPIVVNVDSDVDLSCFDWDALLTPLSDPGLAAVWAPPVEAPGETFADRTSEALLGGSLHAFPMLAGIDRDGMVGKVVALRRTALESVGGFAALREHLGEDAELARRLAASGAALKSSRGVAHSRASGRDLRAAVVRYGRWLTVIRAQRPALLVSYPALFFATPLLVLASTAAVTAGVGGAWSLIAEGVAVSARLLVAWAAARASGRSGGAFARVTDALLADALLALAWASAVTTRSVRWRGRTLRVDAGGTLVVASVPRAERPSHPR